MKNKIILVPLFLIIGFFLGNSFVPEGRAACEDISDIEIFSYALRPVFVRDQLTLTTTEILADKLNKSNYFNVFYADLSNADFSPGNQDGIHIIEVFKTFPLPNLRSLTLNSTKNVSEFLGRVFDSDQREFFSLIQVNINDIGVKDSDIQLIADHIAGYDKIVRDIPQFSARDDSLAFELKINVKKNPHVIVKGPLKPNPFITVYYRAGAQIKRARFQPEVQFE